MFSGESPAVARRRVRLALRAAREARGFTQGHVADELDWSLSKVNRIEKGDVTVSRTDLLAMLELFGIDDQERIEELVHAARRSRQRGWWDDPRYREHQSAAVQQMLQFEGEATAIRYFHPTLIAGLLQTPEYAKVILDFWSEELSDQDRTARLEARLRRREHVLDREDPPDYLLVLDESVLFREVGGPAVMAAQLREVLDVMQRPNVRVRVMPFADAAIVAMLGPFSIFDLGDEENAVLYREGILIDEIVHSSEVINRHRRYFEQMWSSALNEEASVRLVEARAATMISALDRPRSG
jgi:transcriptional regulator with XRE-family HTH domain